MSITKAVALAEDFIKLAETYHDEFIDLKSGDFGYSTYKMKSRAKMKRKSMELSDALVELRKHSAYSDEA